ncbi:unnamed protein product, partial [Closterium sp. NIES-65]
VKWMASKHHPHLVRLLGYCIDFDPSTRNLEQILVYEFMPNSDLDSWIGPGVSSPLSLQQRLDVLIGVAKGLQYLHDFKIVHRDIKPANILLDGKMQAKVADFGLVKLLGGTSVAISEAATRLVGTLGYMDPEYCSSHKPSPAVDVYSFGGVVMPMVVMGREAVHVIKYIFFDDALMLGLQFWRGDAGGCNGAQGCACYRGRSRQYQEMGETQVTMGETQVTVGETQVTVGETQVTVGETQVTVGETQVTVGETQVTVGETQVTMGETQVTVGETQVTMGETQVTVGETQVTVGETQVTMGAVAEFKDPHLEAPDDVVLRLARLALSCTALPGVSRPSMLLVLAELVRIKQEMFGAQVSAEVSGIDTEIGGSDDYSDFSAEMARAIQAAVSGGSSTSMP